MKLKNTLLLLILAVAVYAFIYFFESKQPSTQEATERAGRDKIKALRRDTRALGTSQSRR